MAFDFKAFKEALAEVGGAAKEVGGAFKSLVLDDFSQPLPPPRPYNPSEHGHQSGQRGPLAGASREPDQLRPSHEKNAPSAQMAPVSNGASPPQKTGPLQQKYVQQQHQHHYQGRHPKAGIYEPYYSHYPSVSDHIRAALTKSSTQQPAVDKESKSVIPPLGDSVSQQIHLDAHRRDPHEAYTGSTEYAPNISNTPQHHTSATNPRRSIKIPTSSITGQTNTSHNHNQSLQTLSKSTRASDTGQSGIRPMFLSVANPLQNDPKPAQTERSSQSHDQPAASAPSDLPRYYKPTPLLGHSAGSVNSGPRPIGAAPPTSQNHISPAQSGTRTGMTSSNFGQNDNRPVLSSNHSMSFPNVLNSCDTEASFRGHLMTTQLQKSPEVRDPPRYYKPTPTIGHSTQVLARPARLSDVAPGMSSTTIRYNQPSAKEGEQILQHYPQVTLSSRSRSVPDLQRRNSTSDLTNVSTTLSADNILKRSGSEERGTFRSPRPYISAPTTQGRGYYKSTPDLRQCGLSPAPGHESPGAVLLSMRRNSLGKRSRTPRSLSRASQVSILSSSSSLRYPTSLNLISSWPAGFLPCSVS